MFGDDEADEEVVGKNERSNLLPHSRRESRRKSYGATSEPIGGRIDRMDRIGRRAESHVQGTSRSRSKARTPPRRDPVPGFSNIDTVAPDEEEHTRGRLADERPLSPASARYSSRGRYRRGSQATTRFADDSSGDEGGDVLRGLAATGGGAVFGSGRVGMGMTPGANAAGMEVDPAEELDAEDLELPLTGDGHEAREWTDALRVRRRGESPLIPG